MRVAKEGLVGWVLKESMAPKGSKIDCNCEVFLLVGRLEIVRDVADVF